MADFHKSLTVLREEWQDCEKCELGVRRKQVDGRFVFGEGNTRGVMFIGEGPGVDEEAEGRPFIGHSGSFLRETIHEIGLDNYYISNVVACRSCDQGYDGEGQPRTRTNRRGETYSVIVDQTPTPKQIQACLPRLYEEIYLVDPLLIVALGGEAAKTLAGGKKIAVTQVGGVERRIEIPGAWHLAALTEKKRVWTRTFRGEVRQPVTVNKVSYLMIPILHPAYVLRFHSDQRIGSPIDDFSKHMKKVATVYNRLKREAFTAALSEDYVPT